MCPLYFQRHTSDAVSFTQDWASYASGFGSPDADHWLGNDKLHALTSQAHYQIKMEFEGYDGTLYSYKHSTFKVDSAANKYK